MRAKIGTDWPTYLEYFNRIRDVEYTEGRGFEVGYKIINLLFSSMGLTYWNLVSFISFVICIIFFTATIKITSNFGIVFVLSLYYFFFPSLESIRATIAIVLFYYSINYIENEPKKYLILNLIGIAFHNSALLAFIFYFFFKKTKSRKYIFAAGIAMVLALPIFEKILVFLPKDIYERFLFYFIENGYKISIDKIISIKLVEYIVLLYFTKKVIILDNTINRVSCCLLELGIIIMITLGVISNVAYRFTYYTDWAVVLVYLKIYELSNKRSNKFIVIIGLLLYIIIRFWRNRAFLAMFD